MIINENNKKKQRREGWSEIGRSKQRGWTICRSRQVGATLDSVEELELLIFVEENQGIQVGELTYA